jgi:hypothetical protein
MNQKFYNKHKTIKRGPSCKWGCCWHPDPFGGNPKRVKEVCRRLVRRVNKLSLTSELQASVD